MEQDVQPRFELEPGLEEFLNDAALSGNVTEKEIAFLKTLRFNGARPTPMYFYREVQNLRDPLHFRQGQVSPSTPSVRTKRKRKKATGKGTRGGSNVQALERGPIRPSLRRRWRRAMSRGLRSEYVGFTVDETSRIYTMRVRKPGGELHEFEIAIANQAFLSKRVRYQDAAEICFLKLERELDGCDEDSMPATRLVITDAELDEYRVAHTKKPSPSRPRFSNLGDSAPESSEESSSEPGAPSSSAPDSSSASPDNEP